MQDYFAMSREALQNEREALLDVYGQYKARGLKLDMSRGKPSPAQLDLSMPMLDIKDYMGETGIDSRNYGNLEGMPEARRFFAEMLGAQPDEVIVGGNSSLNMMYSMIELGWRLGYCESEKGWGEEEHPKFLCPAPGYDRHFRVTQYFGFELVTVPMLPHRPGHGRGGAPCERQGGEGHLVRAQVLEPRWLQLQRRDRPPSGHDGDRGARFQDFLGQRVHRPSPHRYARRGAEPAGRVPRGRLREPRADVLLAQQGDVPGASVAAMAASRQNVDYILKNMFPTIISYDKLNQLRHIRFLKDAAGVAAHMEKHRAVIAPKFELVKSIFTREFSGLRRHRPLDRPERRLLPQPVHG